MVKTLFDKLKFYQSAFLFFFAFIIIAIYIIPIDLTPAASDAESIWTYIVSMDTDAPIGSYVMYKGIFSVYPYRWFYVWSKFLGISEFFFVKIYHCLLFSYITAIGIPTIYRRLTGKTIVKFILNIILIVVCFLMWRSTSALSQMMIDLPSAALFIATVSNALALSKTQPTHRNFRLVFAGVLCGIGMCFSGQYSMATLCIVIYIILTEWKTVNRASKISMFLACIAMIVPIVANNVYLVTVVQGLVDNGAWIPSGDLWLMRALTLMTTRYSELAPIGVLESPRGVSVLTDFAGQEYCDSVMAGVNYNFLTWGELLTMWFTHLPDMLVIWFNRLFLALSPDNGCQSIPYLFLFYTCIFICLYKIHKKIHKINDFFQRDTFIFIGFLMSILVPCAMRVEARYALSIQAIILCFSLLDDQIWNSVKDKIISITKIRRNGLAEKEINYVVVHYLVFMLMCFMIFSLLRELQVGSTNCLFTFQL